jgi:hypothetical protein
MYVNEEIRKIRFEVFSTFFLLNGPFIFLILHYLITTAAAIRGKRYIERKFC